MSLFDYSFILAYLPLSVMMYYVLGRFYPKFCNIYLLIISSFFYLLMNSQISIIIFFSILFNYCYYLLIQKIETKINRKKLLIVFLVINIGTLMIFKYNNFFIENINAIFKTKYSLLKLAVPLGISFFTFQQISFLVDLYRNENVIRYPFIEYALHLLFFGWVTSGPIVRHNQVINQFLDDSNKKINYENLSGAFIIFVHGLFKKVIIADTLGKIVNTIYLNLSDLNSTTAFLFAFCYTLQIYFDFSGYSEIAAGIAKFFNIEIPLNFNLPYQSYSFTEFWKKWHISLTSFLTKYIYIPLGGNRRGKVVMYTNTMIVFFVSGFWHGANYTFIIWGLIHGTILCMNKLLNEKFNRITPALRWIITFGIVMLCWVFFRSNNINDAIFIIKKIMVCDFQPLDVSLTNLIHFPEINMLLSFIGLSKMIEHTELMFVIAILLIFLYVMIEKNIILEVKENFIKFKKYRYVFLYCFMGFWSLLNMNEVVTFIYEMF